MIGHFMRTEGYQILEWIGEYMKARGLTHMEVPLPPPTPDQIAIQAACRNLAQEAAQAPVRIMMDILAGQGGHL